MIWPTKTQPIEEYEEEKMEEAFDNLKNVSGRSREEKRDLLYKMILLQSAILGFSVSFVSSDVLQNKLNFCLLKIAWFIMLINVGIGLYLLLVETQFQNKEAIRESFLHSDRREISLKEKSNGRDKYKRMALELLHLSRISNVKISQ